MTDKEFFKSETQKLNSETQKVKCHDCENSIYDKDYNTFWCKGEEVDPDGTCGDGCKQAVN